ncbi:hypothetical protein SCANM124S_05261 [Streptomyces canus]
MTVHAMYRRWARDRGRGVGGDGLVTVAVGWEGMGS